MFGKRPGSGNESTPRERSGGSTAAPPPPPPPAAKVAVANKPAGKAAEPPPPPVSIDSRSDQYYEVKTTIFNALIDTIDLAQLAQLDAAVDKQGAQILHGGHSMPARGRAGVNATAGSAAGCSGSRG